MISNFVKLTWIELKLFCREPFAVIFTLAFPVLILMVLVASFRPDDSSFGGIAPSDYYLPSYIAVVIGALALVAVPVHVAAYRERGVLRRFRASSVSPWSIFGAQTVVGLVTATVGSILLVVVGRFAYDAALPSSVGRVLLAFVLSTMSFLAIGFLLGCLAPNARAAQAIGMLVFFPLWLLSGAGPPPSVMSAGLRTVSDVLPLTYVVRALQEPWQGTGSATTELVRLAVLFVVASVVSTRTFRTA